MASAPNMLRIIKSASKCIYENLALEEWFFRNHNFAKDGDVLITWRNNPAVVIGRYQNPWIEANVCYCQENGIQLARRHSGGGAVYHDLGNLNVSILTTHERHLRKKNLQILASQLNVKLLLPYSRVIANSRDDLIIENGASKISGTAARISHGKAYHHFTLLVDANIEKMHLSLQSPLKDKIETNATRSVRAHSVTCIAKKIAPKYHSSDELFEVVRNIITEVFSAEYARNEISEWDDSGNYTGMDQLISHFKDENWIFGKTPKFCLKLLDTYAEEFETIHVRNGIIEESVNRDLPVGQPFHYCFQHIL